jgi:cytochrome c oxidase subunit 3
LFTEILLFGGLFIVYAAYRSKYPTDFHLAAKELDTLLGAVNTLVLLTSSLTVAISIEALQRGNRKLSLGMLLITIACAFTFMINKYFEWGHKFEIGIYPGSETLLSAANGEILFFNLYYAMTGLHGIHVLVGIVVLSSMFYFVARTPREFEKKYYDQRQFIKLENSGLYWHIVDVIWIFLFPLFYLIS